MSKDTDKEIVIDHKDLSDPNTVTQVIEKAINDVGLDGKRPAVVHMEDDGDGEYKKGKRIIKVRGRIKYFDFGRKR